MSKDFIGKKRKTTTNVDLSDDNQTSLFKVIIKNNNLIE